MTVIVLGAGVDATEGIGMPLTNELIPKINEFIQTEEGANIERKLRSMLPSLRFHFDKFIVESTSKCKITIFFCRTHFWAFQN